MCCLSLLTFVNFQPTISETLTLKHHFANFRLNKLLPVLKLSGFKKTKSIVSHTCDGCLLIIVAVSLNSLTFCFR